MMNNEDLIYLVKRIEPSSWDIGTSTGLAHYYRIPDSTIMKWIKVSDLTEAQKQFSRDKILGDGGQP